MQSQISFGFRCFRWHPKSSRVMCLLFHRKPKKSASSSFTTKVSCKQGKMCMVEQKTTRLDRWFLVLFNMVFLSREPHNNFELETFHFFVVFSFVLELQPSSSIADARRSVYDRLFEIQFWRKITFRFARHFCVFDKKLLANCVTWTMVWTLRLVFRVMWVQLQVRKFPELSSNVW